MRGRPAGCFWPFARVATRVCGQVTKKATVHAGDLESVTCPCRRIVPRWPASDGAGRAALGGRWERLGLRWRAVQAGSAAKGAGARLARSAGSLARPLGACVATLCPRLG